VHKASAATGIRFLLLINGTVRTCAEATPTRRNEAIRNSLVYEMARQLPWRGGGRSEITALRSSQLPTLVKETPVAALKIYRNNSLLQ